MPNETNSSGFRLEDVLFAVARHKWKILICFLLGLVVSGVIYATYKPKYLSTAQLLVKYFVEKPTVTSVGANQEIRAVDAWEDSRINSELVILKSLNTAKEVVKAIGPDKILGPGHGPESIEAAASYLVSNLSADLMKRTSVIVVSFAHENPEVVQEVLEAVIDKYLARHFEIHRAIGAYDFLNEQTDVLQAKLNETEDRLKEIKQQAGVFSIEDTRKVVTKEMMRISEELYKAESDILQHKLNLSRMQKVLEQRGTNAPSEEIEREMRLYRFVLQRLEMFRNQEMEMMLQYTPEHPRVVSNRRAIQQLEEQKIEMEAKNPQLAALAAASSSLVPNSFDPNVEAQQIAALGDRISALKERLQEIQKEGERISEVELKVEKLQRQRELDEASYRYFQTSLEQAKVDATLDPKQIPNISVVQHPSPAYNADKDFMKKLLQPAVGGLLVGLGLAVLLELFLDQTVRRPSEVRYKLGLPLVLTIPERNGKAGAKGLLPSKGGSDGGAVTPWDPNHALRSYFEGLRDRIILHFERLRLSHKPKLIGITSGSEGAGATTIATGLAATFSEMGEGKVLLVDLNLRHGAAHPFFGGKPICGLTDMLESGDPNSAQVQDKLYVASATGANGASIAVRSKKFTDLIPKLKVSDYDYIIFDLPHIDETSVTLRLAPFMDKLLVVIESEKTRRPALKEMANVLAESGVQTSYVLNKTREYLPKWLPQPS